MKGKTATIIGATGLIGSHLLEQLKSDEAFSIVRLITRRPLPNDSPKVEVRVIDFEDRQAFKDAIGGSDVVFCAVGTTQRKVKGDKTAYRKVDYDIPVTAARLCAEMGVAQLLLVSSIGADSGSSNFYTKLKGEVEDAVKGMDIPSISVFRPSLLLGRHNEFRLGEKVGEVVMKLISPLLPTKYKAIRARDVARAMMHASKNMQQGCKVYTNKEMMKLANN